MSARLSFGAPSTGWPVLKETTQVPDILNPEHWHLFDVRSYTSGPMRGHEGCNLDAFDEASGALRAAGIFVFSPADHDRDGGHDFSWSKECSNEDLVKAGFPLDGAILWDLEVIVRKVTDFHLLPGWEASSGARLELEAAKFARRRIWYPDTAYVNGARPGWLLADPCPSPNYPGGPPCL